MRVKFDKLAQNNAKYEMNSFKMDKVAKICPI